MLPDFVLSIVMRPDGITEFCRSMAIKTIDPPYPFQPIAGKPLFRYLCDNRQPTIAQPKIGIDNATLEYRPGYDLWRGHRPCRSIRETGSALERTAR
jgi:hypothetical protein